MSFLSLITATALASKSEPYYAEAVVATVVSHQVVSHRWEHTYLLWFDERIDTNLRSAKPPTTTELSQWRSGASGDKASDCEVAKFGRELAVGQTQPVAIDRSRRLLFLGVGNHISPRLILQKLADFWGQGRNAS